MPLPTPGGSKDKWGKMLNFFLRKSHTEDGDLLPEVIAEIRQGLADGADLAALEGEVEAIDDDLTIEKAKIARVDPGTTLAADEVVSGDGAGNPVKRTYREIGVPWVNPRSDGLSLDGVSDERDAFLGFLAAQPAGSVVAFDDRADLRIDSQVEITKRMLLVGHGASRIHSAAALNVPLLRFNGADGAAVQNLAMDGAETSFNNVSDVGGWAISAVSSDGIVVANVPITGFSRGVNIDTCDSPVVDGVDYTGLVTTNETYVQYHNTLRVISSDYAKISRIAGRDCGSALLVGGGSRYGRVWALDAINCWDNGVYLSEANDWDVAGVAAIMTASVVGVTNTGMKARGNNNHMHHSLVDGYQTGAVISGYGTSGGYLDADGYCGAGSSLADMTIRNTRGAGAIIDLYNGVPARDMALERLRLIGTGQIGSGSTTVYAVLVQGGSGGTGNPGSPRNVTLDDLTIIDHAGGGPAVRFVSAVSGKEFIAPVVRNLDVRNTAAVSSAMALRMNYCIDPEVRDARVENIPSAAWALYFENCTNGLVTGTTKRGTAGTKTIGIASGTTNMRAYLNHNATLSDSGSGTITTP